MVTVTDTLVVDTASLNAWRADGDYDYGRELVQSDFSLLEWLLNKIGKGLDSVFGSNFYHHFGTTFWVVIGILLVAGIVVFMLYQHPELFRRNDKLASVGETEVDTIYGIDFPKAISRALDHGDYREAVRMIYLQTLKTLSDAGRIDWQLYKTPTQYTYEVRTAEFRTFTRHFLRVRYGNFAATADLCDEMKRLQAEIEKGGAE